MPMYGSPAKKNKPQEPPMLGLPEMTTYPLPGAAPTIANRMSQLGGSVDVAPTWGNSMSVPPMPVPTSPPAMAAPMLPPPVPPLTDPAAMPEAKMPAAPPVAPGWAAANPLASASGGEIFGAPIRRGIFRQMYQTGKGLGGVAGQSLMNIGRPPIPEADPLAGMMRRPEPATPPPPRVPPLPPSPQPPGREAHPAHLQASYRRQQPQRSAPSGGRAGRLMDRMRGGTAPQSRQRRAGY